MFFKVNASSLIKTTNVGRVNYQKPWKHFNRISDEYILFIINGGELFLEEDGMKYHIKKGDFFILEPNKKHVGFKESTCEYYYFHFKSNQIETLMDNDENKKRITGEHSTYFYDEKNYDDYHVYIPKQYSFKDLNLFHIVTNLVEGAINDHFSYRHHYPITISSRLMEIMVIINRILLTEIKEGHQNTISKTYFTAQRLKQFIESNVYRTITKEEIVERFDFNYDYLNRLFNKYHGCSIHQYNLLNKIETAKTILRYNDIKMNEVGYLIGIDNQYYFSKLFKKIVGVSPMDYYKSVRISSDNK